MVTCGSLPDPLTVSGRQPDLQEFRFRHRDSFPCSRDTSCYRNDTNDEACLPSHIVLHLYVLVFHSQPWSTPVWIGKLLISSQAAAV